MGYVYELMIKVCLGLRPVKDDYKVNSDETSGSGHYYISLKVGTYTVRYETEDYQTQTLDKLYREELEMLITAGGSVDLPFKNNRVGLLSFTFRGR